jgi:MerR family redox-sensitive transcriptional activator SoxR
VASDLAIGEVAHRAGVSVPTLRFYESRGLIAADRTAGNQRRFPRHVLRRVAVIRAAQRLGLSLADIRDALSHLPEDRAPSKDDWAELSGSWRDALSARIEAMTRLRDGLEGCIGCGCLSMDTCPIYNADDHLAAEGPGARRLPPAARPD